MLFDKLSIMITDRCNAECDFCCLNCSPHGSRVLPEKDIRRVIREARDLDGLEEICFTGGEPLLYEPLVESCAAFAKELGLRSSVYTNGFWGADERKAKEWAEKLKEAGVYRMHFSADPFHQKYVPLSSLKTAMQISREAGFANELSIMEIRGSTHWKEIWAEMPDEVFYAQVVFHPLLPVGRAKHYFTEGQILKLFRPEQAQCFYSRMASLTVDGTYILCCSMYAQNIPGIVLGHMNDVSAAGLERIALSDDYRFLMLKEGFGWYMRRLRELGRDVPEKICFPCVCCEMVFNDPEFMARIADEVHERAERIRRETGGRI